MTSNMKHVRRAFMALSLACLLLPPVVSATVNVGLPGVSLGASKCHPATYAKQWGYISFYGSNSKHTAYGEWRDGCGGKACDDAVYGGIRFGNSYNTFYVMEKGKDAHGNCQVECTLDAPQGSTRWKGYVKPDGSDGVAFSCDGWFHGYLGSPDVNTIIDFAPSIQADA